MAGWRAAGSGPAALTTASHPHTSLTIPCLTALLSPFCSCLSLCSAVVFTVQIYRTPSFYCPDLVLVSADPFSFLFTFVARSADRRRSLAVRELYTTAALDIHPIAPPPPREHLVFHLSTRSFVTATGSSTIRSFYFSSHLLVGAFFIRPFLDDHFLSLRNNLPCPKRIIIGTEIATTE